MTENRQFTRTEINKIIHDVCIDLYKLYGNEMSFGEKLFFTDIHETIENQVDYKMELLENGDVND